MSLVQHLAVDMGVLVSKMMPMCEMQLVKCDLVDSACNGELTVSALAFAGENFKYTEASHCRLSRELSCDTMLCPPTVSRLLKVDNNGTEIHAQLS